MLTSSPSSIKSNFRTLLVVPVGFLLINAAPPNAPRTRAPPAIATISARLAGLAAVASTGAGGALSAIRASPMAWSLCRGSFSRHRARSVLIERLGQTEVKHLHLAITRDLDVRRLEIAVDDPTVVRRFQGFCNLRRRDERFVQGNRAAREPLLDRFAVNQLEDEHGHPLAGRVVLFDAVDCRNVRMVQRGEQTGLALEARQPIRIGQEQGRKYFAGDVSLQPKIAGAVDLTHPARPERSGDLVATDPGPRG